MFKPSSTILLHLHHEEEDDGHDEGVDAQRFGEGDGEDHIGGDGAGGVGVASDGAHRAGAEDADAHAGADDADGDGQPGGQVFGSDLGEALPRHRQQRRYHCQVNCHC